MDYTGIEWDATALIVIDVQNDFIDGALPVPGTTDVLPDLARLLAAFREAGRPVAYAIRLYEPGSSDADPVRRDAIEQGAHIVAPDTPGAQIPELITGQPIRLACDTLMSGEPQTICSNEVIFYKPRWSAFYRTELQAWLSHHRITSVLVPGCNLPNCPRATLFDATERDLRAGIVTDAVSQVTPDRLADLTLTGVQQVTVDEVINQLTKAPPRGAPAIRSRRD